MDIGIAALLGTIYRWLYNAIKNALGLSDQSAAWGMIALALLTATGYNIVSGGFAGIDFSTSDPTEALKAIGAAWVAIYGTAQAWFSVTKKRN